MIINKISASSFVILFCRRSSAQFLLPMGNPKRKPESNTNAPDSLTGMICFKIGNIFPVKEGRIFDEMIILDKMANGSNAGKICSNQSTSPFAAAFTVTAGYFNM